MRFDAKSVFDLDVAINLLVAGAVVYFVQMPDGPVRRAISGWQQGRDASALVEDAWSSLAASTSRLNEGNGPVVLVEFSDYECPFCRRTHPELQKFLAEHPTVQVAYRHLPLRIHPHAEIAARAAICAEEESAFRSMHDYLITSEEWMRDPNWRLVAQATGILDYDQFEACLSSPRTDSRLAEDKALAERLGIRGTPGFAYQFGLRFGAVTADQLEAILPD